MDKNLSPLDLSREAVHEYPTTTDEATWKSKVLHGKFPNKLVSDEMDKDASVVIFKRGLLTARTVVTQFAIQGQIVATKTRL